MVLALLLLSLTGVATAASHDTDGDGLRNTFEHQSGVTSPNDSDSDGDGVVDSAEDNDGDRLSNRGEQKFGSHPGVRDTDGDGKPDGTEDADRDGRSNAVEQDHRPIPAGLAPSLAAAPGDVSPYNRVNPVACLKKHTKNISKCVTSRKPLYKRKIELALEDATEMMGARFRRFYDKVCPYDPCPIIQGEVLMYRDRGHITATFADQLTPTFRALLTAIIPPAPAATRKG